MLNKETIIIKIGGSIQNDENALQHLYHDIQVLYQKGYPILLVPGGGVEIDAYCERLKIPQQKINGLRVTDQETLLITQMTLIGKTNVLNVSGLIKHKIKAIGLSGIDGGLVVAQKYTDESNTDYGYVGFVKAVNPEIIETLFHNQYVIVLSPIAQDESGQIYNINGDIMAAAIAKALPNSRLIYLSDTKGIYENVKDESTRIPHLNLEMAKNLLQSNKISNGMIPKLSSCIHALENGIKDIYILDGRQGGHLIDCVLNKTCPLGTVCRL